MYESVGGYSLKLESRIALLLHNGYSISDNNEIMAIIEEINDYYGDPEFYNALISILLSQEYDISIKISACVQFRLSIGSTTMQDSLKRKILEKIPLIIQESSIYQLNSFRLVIDTFIERYYFSLGDIHEHILLLFDISPVSAILIYNSFLHSTRIEEEYNQQILARISILFDPEADNDLSLLYLSISRQILMRIHVSNTYILHFQKKCLTFINTKSLAFMSQLIKSNQEYDIDMFYAFIQNAWLNINESSSPKYLIRFFSLIQFSTTDDQIWSILSEDFSSIFESVFLPMFTINECLNDPVQFICDYYFDSFSDMNDPRAAAFRSLESIASKRSEVIYYIYNYVVQSLSSETSSYQIYSISLLASSVWKELARENLPLLFSFSSQVAFSQDNELVLSSNLLLISFEYFGKPILEHVNYSLTLLVSSKSSLVKYFATLAASRLVPKYEDKQEILQNFSSCMIDIIYSIIGVATMFTVPQFADLAGFFLCEPDVISSISSIIPQFVESSFALLKTIEDYSISLANVFNTLMILVSTTKDAELCQFIFVRTIRLPINNYILDLLNTCVFNSPSSFPEMWDAFPILLDAFNSFGDLEQENSIILFSNIVLLDPLNAQKEDNLISIATYLLENDCALPFIASVLLVQPNQGLYIKILKNIHENWSNAIDYPQALWVVLNIDHMKFEHVFGEDVHEFATDVVDLCESYADLMLLIPLIFEYLDDEQKIEVITRIQSEQDIKNEEIYNGTIHTLPFCSTQDALILYQSFLQTIG